ncbi:MAG: recombination mediator RecR [Chthoniobacterales bacterium]
MSRSLAYPAPFAELINELRRLPGIGPRSAERIALWLLTSKDARVSELSTALTTAKEKIRTCACCGFFSIGELCPICEDSSRAEKEICIVEQATDILAVEKSGSFQGRYHALGGKLSPLDHIGPEDLRISSLLERVKNESPTEIILALSADVEGEATTSYLVEVLAHTNIPITRIAHGLPAGGGLEHADDLTLSRALSGRRTLSGVEMKLTNPPTST